MKIIFFGTTDFASAGLKALVENGYDVAAVVTTPDRPQGRHLNLVPCHVKLTAQSLGIGNILEPEKLKSPDFIDKLKSFDADLFVVIAFRMLPEIVWSMPRLGTVNIHGSLLPAYRGASPIARAIINGETRTGVTSFLLSHQIDTGDILQSLSTEIGPEESFGELYLRLMSMGAELLISTVKSICEGTAVPRKQSSPEDGTLLPTAPKIFTSDCQINWKLPASEVHNLIRGLSPEPCAFSQLFSKNTPPAKIKIISCRVAENCDDLKPNPGDVTVAGKRLFVTCTQGAIEILELQPAGKKPMSAKSYLNGARFSEAVFSSSCRPE